MYSSNRVLAPLLLLALAGPASAASPDVLWPCIQPKVAELAAGQMWAGPPLTDAKWRDDQDVAELVPVIAARRTSIEDATTKIEAFAKDAGADKKARLTLLFAGVFEEINGLRSRILNGIERYSQHQIDLSKRIKDESLKVAQAKKAAASDDEKAKAAELEQQLLWDTRIYDSRSQAVSAVCESPVILEQRAFSIARAIQNVME
jgi:hypothetical protein